MPYVFATISSVLRGTHSAWSNPNRTQKTSSAKPSTFQGVDGFVFCARLNALCQWEISSRTFFSSCVVHLDFLRHSRTTTPWFVARSSCQSVTASRMRAALHHWPSWVAPGRPHGNEVGLEELQELLTHEAGPPLARHAGTLIVTSNLTAAN